LSEDTGARTTLTPLARAFSRPVVRQSLAVAAVVGTLLNCVNQGEALLAGAAVNVPKLLLTYAIPYLVSTYGAWSMARSMK
jgi:hypothetical protein